MLKTAWFWQNHPLIYSSWVFLKNQQFFTWYKFQTKYIYSLKGLTKSYWMHVLVSKFFTLNSSYELSKPHSCECTIHCPSRHYGAKLDGCGLELENQVRKSYRVLLVKLIDIINAFKSPPSRCVNQWSIFIVYIFMPHCVHVPLFCVWVACTILLAVIWY